MKLRVAGVIKESVVDGPGLRLVVFVQGCPHHCPGCHNAHTWDPAGGAEMAVAEIASMVRANPLLKGVTLSGGEPFEQAAALAMLAAQVREAGKDVITYTGYTWENLLARAGEEKEIRELLDASDFLVDGPFLQERRNPDLLFRGSDNQRIIDVTASIEAGRVIAARWASV